jgi:chaperone BCS1
LNTLDGPESKEGHIVILTTNAPDSLDKALYLPGRIELKVFLGYSTCVTAGITFMRIFGSDSQKSPMKRDTSILLRSIEPQLMDDAEHVWGNERGGRN